MEPSEPLTSTFKDEWGLTRRNATNAPFTFASLPSAYMPAREWCACSEALAISNPHRTTHRKVHLAIRTSRDPRTKISSRPPRRCLRLRQHLSTSKSQLPTPKRLGCLGIGCWRLGVDAFHTP